MSETMAKTLFMFFHFVYDAVTARVLTDGIIRQLPQTIHASLSQDIYRQVLDGYRYEYVSFLRDFATRLLEIHINLSKDLESLADNIENRMYDMLQITAFIRTFHNLMIHLFALFPWIHQLRKPPDNISLLEYYIRILTQNHDLILRSVNRPTPGKGQGQGQTPKQSKKQGQRQTPKQCKGQGQAQTRKRGQGQGQGQEQTPKRGQGHGDGHRIGDSSVTGTQVDPMHMIVDDRLGWTGLQKHVAGNYKNKFKFSILRDVLESVGLEMKELRAQELQHLYKEYDALMKRHGQAPPIGVREVAQHFRGRKFFRALLLNRLLRQVFGLQTQDIQRFIPLQEYRALSQSYHSLQGKTEDMAKTLRDIHPQIFQSIERRKREREELDTIVQYFRHVLQIQDTDTDLMREVYKKINGQIVPLPGEDRMAYVMRYNSALAKAFMDARDLRRRPSQRQV